jgi:molecular chaperone GrpE
MKAKDKDKKGNKERENNKGNEKEFDDLRDQLARALADYDNLRKRIDKEKGVLEKLITAKFILRILPIYDMLVDAQAHLKDAGVEMILQEFTNTLNDEGVEKIKVDNGMKFDEGLHEAVETVKGKDKGKIAEVVVSGWKFADGGLIRPAKVKVYN